MKENRLDEAYKLFESAYELMAPGKPTHPAVMMTRYQQGVVRMRQAKSSDEPRPLQEDAICHFNDALTICLIHEKQRGDRGETARVQWRLSQIFSETGREVEAKAYLDAALDTRETLSATGKFAHSDDEEDAWDSFVGFLWR